MAASTASRSQFAIGELYQSRGNADKAARQLGWKPRTSFEELFVQPLYEPDLVPSGGEVVTDNWTEAERLAAEVLSSGSDEALRGLLVELDKAPPSPVRSGTQPHSSTTRRSRTGSGEPIWW